MDDLLSNPFVIKMMLIVKPHRQRIKGPWVAFQPQAPCVAAVGVVGSLETHSLEGASRQERKKGLLSENDW